MLHIGVQRVNEFPRIFLKLNKQVLDQKKLHTLSTRKKKKKKKEKVMVDSDKAIVN